MCLNSGKYIFTLVLALSGSGASAELIEVSSKELENTLEQAQAGVNSGGTQPIPNLKETLRENSSDKIADKPAENSVQESQAKNVAEKPSEKASEKSKGDIVKNSAEQKTAETAKPVSLPGKKEIALPKLDKIKNSSNPQTAVNNSNNMFRTERTQEDNKDYPIKAFVSTSSAKKQTVAEPARKAADSKTLPQCTGETLIVQTFDEAGKLLAGLLDKDNEPAFYKSYSDYITKSWAKLDANCFCKIRTWRDKNLPESILNAKTVFYPFGGPDAAYAILLFPNAENYVLVGQEKTGLSQLVLNTAFSESVLNNIKKSEKNFFEKGYFVTLEMLSNLNNSSLTGVLPIAMLTISKLGYEILEVTNGNPVSKDVGTVKIKFRDTQTNQEKNLYYVRCGLEDRSAHISELLAFVSSLGDFATFFKSCSYKMHQKGFEKIKSFVLNKSSAILQDDTGIKFDKVDKNVFDYKLFGSYEKPSLDVFRNFKQASLARAYSQAKPEPFDFCIGYIGDANVRNKNYKNINLQLFSKKVAKNNSDNKVEDNNK